MHRACNTISGYTPPPKKKTFKNTNKPIHSLWWKNELLSEGKNSLRNIFGLLLIINTSYQSYLYNLLHHGVLEGKNSSSICYATFLVYY